MTPVTPHRQTFPNQETSGKVDATFHARMVAWALRRRLRTTVPNHTVKMSDVYRRFLRFWQRIGYSWQSPTFSVRHCTKFSGVIKELRKFLRNLNFLESSLLNSKVWNRRQMREIWKSARSINCIAEAFCFLSRMWAQSCWIGSIFWIRIICEAFLQIIPF